MDIDLLIQNVVVFNAYCKKFIPADVAILDGKFLYIGKQAIGQLHPQKVIDGKGKYLIPGLIDIHMHIESSMATPQAFSHELIKNGITTIVAEPHEIANVLGLEGIQAFQQAAQNCTVDIFWGIPSSVPSTSPELETSGCEINLPELEKLLQNDHVICLGEVMNYVDVINNPHAKTNQFITYIKQKSPHLAIEGHCPKLIGLDLAKFIYAGVDSDHTQQMPLGLQERFLNGMFIEIQEKSLTPEIIDCLINNQMYEHFAFVTDDVMADCLAQEGHLNRIVKKAIQLGMRPEHAIYAATFTPSQRMGLKDRGSIAPGKIADFLLLDSLENLVIFSTYKNGQEVFQQPTYSDFTALPDSFPKHFYQTVHLAPVREDSFRIKADTTRASASCRIIKVSDGTTFTQELVADIPVRNGLLDWENSPYCLAAVFERHGKNKNVGLGLIAGAVIERGAVATTYAHDHHNLLVMGKNKQDMVLAANTVISSQGGYCVVDNGKVVAKVDLPVAGILSEASIDEIGRQVALVKQAMQNLGYHHHNPIMSFSTLSLPVSQELKITDKGLIKVAEQKIVDIIK
ncbi:Adenine deaminase [Sporomusa rhizae]|uniref:adenine deaminase n=1 Tax=Sporomusa rhizae TaxID=357999 RepID=UPI00352B0282